MDDFISISELARRANVARQTLDRWRLQGRITPAAVVSGRDVFDTETIKLCRAYKRTWALTQQQEITNDSDKTQQD